jgi:hypothetical protein
MNFLRGKNSLCLLGLGVVVFGMGGCSQTCGSKVFLDAPDYPPGKIATYYMAMAGGPLTTEELQVGNGRVAQPGRKMKIRVEAADSSGNSYGSGTVSFVDPPFDWKTWGPGVDSGTVPPEFMTAMGGMREGGVRKFTLAAVPVSYTNAVTELNDGDSHQNVIQYPRGVEVIFTVTLQKVCKPKFCSLTTYSIIDVGKHRQSRETSCK